MAKKKRYTVHFYTAFTEEAESKDEAIEMASAELSEDPTNGDWTILDEETEESGDFPNPNAILDIAIGKWWF